ncbi:hypothetical protein LCGC14_1627990 [marine sediment metagenome]|uniref:Uncharacterized protein n=1 Tax=marine sediment metagenome TaxID=412755 RepID=A0A0F9L378_9ZZZZ
MDNKLTNIEKSIISIEISLKWHKRLILGLYGLVGVFLMSSVSNGSINGAITGFSVKNIPEVVMMDWSILQPLLIVLAALARSVVGWLKASLKDGYIQEYEFKLLGETIVRVGLIGVIIAYLPWFDVTWMEVSAIALGGDLLLNAVKKRRTPEAA